MYSQEVCKRQRRGSPKCRCNSQTTHLTSVERRIMEPAATEKNYKVRKEGMLEIEAICGVHDNTSFLLFRGIVPAPATPPNASSVQRHANLQHAIIVHFSTTHNTSTILFLLARLLPAFCTRERSALSPQNPLRTSPTISVDVMIRYSPAAVFFFFGAPLPLLFAIWICSSLSSSSSS